MDDARERPERTDRADGRPEGSSPRPPCRQPTTPSVSTELSSMQRLFALVVFALVAGAAITSCGGGGDSAAPVVATPDKLTIVGAGS